MAWTEAALRRRARLAYERRRLRRAAVAAWPVAPITVVAALTCGPAAPTLLAAGALALAVAGFRFRGGAAGRAVTPGLLAGVPLFGLTLATPTLAALLGDSCSSACRLLAALCLGGGLITGGLLAAAAPRGISLPAALAVAGLTGAVGCAVLGAAGIVGIAAGLAVAAAPALVRRHT
jgi:hypothetical protein